MRICSKRRNRFGAMEKSFLSVVIVLSVTALLLFFSSCNDTVDPPSEPTEAPFAMDTSVTLCAPMTVESDSVSLTVRSLDFNGYYGPELSVSIENRSDRTLQIQVYELCVNDFVIGTMMSGEVEPSAQVETALTLLHSDLEDARIASIETITVSFVAFDPDTGETVWTSDPIELLCTGRASDNEEPDVSGTVVYQSDGLSVVAQKGLSSLDGIGESCRFYVENNTERAILVQCFSAKVNGATMYPLFSSPIPAGCRALPYMTFLNSSLEENGIEQMETVEFSLVFMDSNTYETLAESEWISLTVS